MPPESPVSIEQITNKKLANTLNQFDMLNNLNLTDTQREAFEKLQPQAIALIQRMQLQLETGDPEAIVNMAEELYTLFEDATKLVANSFSNNVQQVFGVSSADDLVKAIEDGHDRATKNLEGNHLNNIAKQFQQIGVRLGVTAEQIRQGEKIGSYYLVHAGSVIANLSLIQKDKQFLIDAIGNTGVSGLSPELVAHAKTLLQGLEAIRNVNPMQTNYYDWYKKEFGRYGKGKRPMLLAVAGIGAAITLLGLTHVIRGKGFSMATAFWAIVTAFALKPNLLQSGGRYGLEALTKFNNPQLRDIMGKGVRGDEGAAAYEELQDLYKDVESKKLIASYVKPGFQIENAHVAALTGGTTSTLYKVFSRLSAGDKRKALQTFGKQNDQMAPLFAQFIRGATL